MNFTIAEICKKGGRQVNQDCVGKCETEGRICLIACDGLGAYLDSGTASRLCVETVLERFGSGEKPVAADAIAAYLNAAHDRIVTAKLKGEMDASSCTTVACVFSDGEIAAIAHIGDTRVHYFKNGRLKFRTSDHSLAQRDVDRGKIDPEQLRFHKDQNKLTRVLGGKYFVLPDLRYLDVPLARGDAFLLCTDGFWEYVTAAEMEEDLGSAETPAGALAKMETRIAAKAEDNNDNYSAVLAVVR